MLFLLIFSRFSRWRFVFSAPKFLLFFGKMENCETRHRKENEKMNYIVHKSKAFHPNVCKRRISECKEDFEAYNFSIHNTQFFCGERKNYKSLSCATAVEPFGCVPKRRKSSSTKLLCAAIISSVDCNICNICAIKTFNEI